MILSRSRLRLPAAFVTCLLLLTGAGEVLGACYCAHRGGQPMEGHGPAHGAVGETPSAGHVDAGHFEEEGTEDPASQACRALCALACSNNTGPAPDVSERAPDLVTCGAAAPAPPVESADMVPPTTRPHILPLSQAPPTTS